MSTLRPSTSLEREVSVRELRNHTSSVLHDVEEGNTVAITVNKRPVAKLVPLSQKPQWISGAKATKQLADALADPELATTLKTLSLQTTDEL